MAMVRDMHLTTHGHIVAVSDTERGVTVILAPDDGITDADWLDAISAHDVSENYADWDYSETDGWCVWTLLRAARITFTFESEPKPRKKDNPTFRESEVSIRMALRDTWGRAVPTLSLP